MTSRLLLEARFADHAEGFVDKYPEVGDPYRKAIPVRELSTGSCIAARAIVACRSFSARRTRRSPCRPPASASYVTGSHAMKVGFQNDFGTHYAGAVGQRVRALLLVCDQRRRAHLPPAACAAVYADDRICRGHGHLRAGQVDVQRATINAGVRFDYFKNNFPEQVLGPASFVPEPQSRNPGDPLRQHEGHHAARRRRVRSLRQREDLAQEQLGQVHDRLESPRGQPASRCSPTPRTGAGRPAWLPDNPELLHRRSAI